MFVEVQLKSLRGSWPSFYIVTVPCETAMWGKLTDHLGSLMTLDRFSNICVIIDWISYTRRRMSIHLNIAPTFGNSLNMCAKHPIVDMLHVFLWPEAALINFICHCVAHTSFDKSLYFDRIMSSLHLHSFAHWLAKNHQILALKLEMEEMCLDISLKFLSQQYMKETHLQI